MMPGLNPNDMKKVMKKMGIKQEEIDASEVVIKCPDKNLLIKNPNVLKINMAGQDSFQITGDVVEVNLISEEDIRTVVDQTGVSYENARVALENSSGDLAEAIISLKQ